MSNLLLGNAPIPISDPIARPKRTDRFGQKQTDPLEGTMSDPWVDYFSRMALTIQAAATRIHSATRVDVGAAIGATDITGGVIKTGLYRLTYYTRVSRAAGTSSAVQVTLAWTDGGVPQSQTGALLNANTTTTLESRSFLIHIDANSPVTYAVAYASVGAPSMQYRIDVVLEAVFA
jgi:hypothetical protein